MDSVQIVSDGKLTKPADPVRAKHTFIVWFLDKQLTMPYDFDKAVKGSFTLYASWSEPEVRKIFHRNLLHGKTRLLMFQKAIGSIVMLSMFNLFAPDMKITREQMAAFLWRYAQITNIDVSVGEDTNILSYADAFEISEYAISAMQWACGNGIIRGKPGGFLDPQGGSTRAEVAAMLHRFLEK